MGFFKFLGELAKDFLEPSGTKYNVECKSFELFEIGTVWRGTARVHGAGAHVETVSVNVTTTVFLPDHSDNSKYTERGLLRRDLRDWAGKEFALSGEISRDMVVLNDGENCLSIEGYVKKVDGKWKLVDDSGSASHYGAYKLCISDKNGAVGHDELHYLFKADTIGRVTSVDVHDGF